MAACGFNYKKLMKKLRVNALWLYTKWVVKLRRLVELTTFHQSRIQTPHIQLINATFRFEILSLLQNRKEGQFPLSLLC